MFYRMYLSSVCNRRQWPDPHYEPYRNRQGYYCKVRVNNREYCTDVPYATEDLARDGAAMKAFMICRNFSANDGMYPGQRPGQSSANGVVQGLPVAIGTGRRNKRISSSSYETSSSDEMMTPGNSPRSQESGFGQRYHQPTQQMPKPSSRRRQPVDEYLYMCYCKRGPVHAYGRCGLCCRESGWA